MESNQNKPVFSIIMAIYNAKEAMLRRAIDSVRSQNFDKWELIILNNGGEYEKNTRQIINEYENADSRIRGIESKHNIGWAKGTSICMNYVRGEYMTFLAQDDFFIGNDVFSRISREIDVHDPDVIWVGWIVSVLQDNEYVIQGGKIPRYRVLNRDNPVQNCVEIMSTLYYNSMFHFEKLDFLKKWKINFYEPYYCDCGGTTEAMCRAENMVIIDLPVYNLTLNTSQTSGGFLWQSYKYIFSVQWLSLKRLFAEQGYYNYQVYSYVAKRLYSNLFGEIEGLCKGERRIRDKEMQPLVKTELECLTELEHILEDTTYEEIMFYVGRDKFEHDVMKNAVVLFERCIAKFDINDIRRSAKWLPDLILGLYSIEEGKLCKKADVTNEDSLMMRNAILCSDNISCFGMELILDKAELFDTENWNAIIQSLIVRRLYFIQNLLECAVSWGERKHNAALKHNIRETCLKILQSFEIDIPVSVSDTIKQNIDGITSNN